MKVIFIHLSQPSGKTVGAKLKQMECFRCFDLQKMALRLNEDICGRDDEREVMRDDVAGLTAVGLVRAVGAVGVLVAHPQLGDAVHCGLALKLGRRASVLGWRNKDIM